MSALLRVEVVRFVSDCEDGGIVLAHCPLFVREGIIRERAEGTDLEARRKIGFTIASILEAIYSTGIRSDVWNHLRAATKMMAQAAVVANSSRSAQETHLMIARPTEHLLPDRDA